jgi:O-antigen ligase
MLYDPVAFGVLVDKWTGTFGVFGSGRGVSRVRHVHLAMDAISETPITVLFGRGLEAYGAYADLVVAHLGQYNVLHSMHLQVLAGGGLVGVFLYSGYIVSAWWRSRQLVDRQAGALSRVLIVATLLYGAFHPQVVSRVLFFVVPVVLASCPSGRLDVSARNESSDCTMSSSVS